MSRDIRLFHLMFARCMVGEDQLLDETYGRAPKVLENFLQAWKQLQTEVVDWSSFFRFTGCSPRLQECITSNEVGWVMTCVARATSRGKMYTSKL